MAIVDDLSQVGNSNEETYTEEEAVTIAGSFGLHRRSVSIQSSMDSYKQSWFHEVRVWLMSVKTLATSNNGPLDHDSSPHLNTWSWSWKWGCRFYNTSTCNNIGTSLNRWLCECRHTVWLLGVYWGGSKWFQYSVLCSWHQTTGSTFSPENLPSVLSGVSWDDKNSGSREGSSGVGDVLKRKSTAMNIVGRSRGSCCQHQHKSRRFSSKNLLEN